MKTTITQILTFIKQLRVLVWLEIFEKWFGFFLKLLWISAFIAFGIYLNKEYKKNTYYLKDFKVPNSWVEQGYTGDVVKEAILDEIDIIKEEDSKPFGRNKNIQLIRNKDNDNTQILSEINVEGFNLKVIVKTILSILGKKDKNIGGYVTVSDSTQTIAIQITDQITKQFSIGRKASVKNLVHNATLHIMRIKQPLTLLNYYGNRNDIVAVLDVFKYLQSHRNVINDDDFYIASSGIALFTKDFDKADAWADSLLQRFPNEMTAYTIKANSYLYRAKYSNIDTLEKIKYGQLSADYLKKAIIHNTINGEKVPLTRLYFQLSGYYFDLNNEKLGMEYLNKIETFDAETYNYLGYVYIKQKNYSKAELAFKSATNDAPENGNYWDSLGELYALQGKDSLSVVYLRKALKSPVKVEGVSIEAYKKDPRWQRLQKRKDFQLLLHK
jgi:tetratricopeptide (TPR) repeat protein